MKKNVFLSIIVPIYNVEKYIGSLVNSLVRLFLLMTDQLMKACKF